MSDSASSPGDRPPRVRPPERFRRYLLRVLPEGVVGDSIVGDLDQELREMASAGTGAFRARLWYRWEALKLGLRWSLEGLRRTPGGAPGIEDDDPPSHRRAVAVTKGGWAMGWVADMKFGIRMLVKSPLVTLVAAVSIGLGIGASTSMFSIYWSFLMSPLPYADQDELVLVQQPERTSRFTTGTAPAPFLEYVEGASSFESWAAWRSVPGTLTGGDAPVQVTVIRTWPRSFSALGRRPFLGRDFTPEDGRPGAPPTAILHHDLWASRFASDPSVVGQTLSMDGVATTVIGVMPDDFDLLISGAGDQVVFVPDDFQEERANFDRRILTVVGRLGSGTPVDAAAAEIGSIFGRIRSERGGELEEQVARASLLRSEIPGESDTRLVQVLLAVGVFVLLLAAANVANLLLARAEERQGEVAIRAALGAGRVRILRQLLTESILLALLGAVLGVGLAVFGIQGIDAALPPQIPDAMRPSLNAPALLFTGGLALATGIFFGLAPALQSLRGDVRAHLGEGSRGGTAARERKLVRGAFVSGQVAVALALLVGASALVQVARSMVGADPGFREEGLLTFTTTFPEGRYPEDGDLVRAVRELERGLSSVPGVEGVAVMRFLPRSPSLSLLDFSLASDAPDPDAGRRQSSLETVSPGWFETLGVELRAGRILTASDGPDPPTVTVVNRAFAARHFPGGDAVGRRLILTGGEEVTVVGVVEDILHQRVPLGEEYEAVAYLPLAQRPRRSPALAVRAAGDPGALAPAVRQAVWRVDPELPVADLQTLDAYVEGQMAAPRFLGWALTLFGFLALALSAMGIWGVMAHSVKLRSRELGIRMAMGARPPGLVSLVSRQGLTLTAVGIVLGTPLAVLLVRFAGGVTADFDADMGGPLLYLAVGGVLVVVATLASVVPALGATRVDPAKALAAE